MTTTDDGQLFENAVLCKYLLDEVGASSRLEIRTSLIPGAGSALFTKANFADGVEVFGSIPLASTVLDTTQNVCGYCFKDGESRVHPSGRFRSKNDSVEVFPACEKCGLLRSCSESCYKMAHNAYHQHECQHLSEGAIISAKVRALYRILLLRSNNLLSDQMWQSLYKMESHYEARMSGPAASAIQDIATEAKQRADSLESVESISRLYCILLTNNICIREAGQSKVLGTALDIVMSLMNHSCEPNVLTVFHGNRLCVRSLRPIQAGEELLQCYTDETCDVLLRRKKLLEQYHFVCECHRCVQEFEAHRSWSSGDVTRIDSVQRAQEEVTDMINTSLVQFASDPDHRSTAVSTLESQALALLADAFSESPWPNKLDPLPTLHKRLATMSSMVGQPLSALRYSLKGCAFTEVRCGPDWANDLLDLIKLLVPVASNARSFGEEMSIHPAELWVVFIGYLHILVAHARQLYGENVIYTKALEKWEAETSPNPLLPTTAGFKRKLQAAHSKLLGWAGVENPLTAWVLKT